MRCKIISSITYVKMITMRSSIDQYEEKIMIFSCFLENGWALTLIVLYFDEIYV